MSPIDRAPRYDEHGLPDPLPDTLRAAPPEFQKQYTDISKALWEVSRQLDKLQGEVSHDIDRAARLAGLNYDIADLQALGRTGYHSFSEKVYDLKIALDAALYKARVERPYRS